jgi:hypothetical protein
MEIGVTATGRARLLGETAVCAPLLTVLVLEHEPRHTDALEESMPELGQLLYRYLEHLHRHRGGGRNQGRVSARLIPLSLFSPDLKPGESRY